MKLKIELEDAVAARNGAEQGELIARTECHKQARRAAEVRAVNNQVRCRAVGYRVDMFRPKRSMKES